LTGLTWSGLVSGSVAFGYDASFRMTSQAVNHSSLLFGYDNDNVLTGAGALTLTRDPQNGRVTGTTLGLVTDAYAYDANGLFASYTAQYSGSTLYSESVVRDPTGRITQQTESLGSTTHVRGYTFDASGRLTDVSEDGSAVSHYGYDADDNRTTYQTFGANATTISPTYDAQDRLLTYGNATYQYTANGELTSKTDDTGTTSYTYDPLGNLLNVDLPSSTAIAYVVDGENRRAGKQLSGTLTEGFLCQDALNVVAQLDGSGNLVAQFVFGTKPNVPDYFTGAAGTFRILSDHLGSPRLVVDTSGGNIAEEIDYDEFGNVTNDTSPGLTPFGFAGGLYDKDTGLVRFGARDYDASVGRWTAKDPMKFAGGMNLYGYVVNDPIDGLDSSGRANLCQGNPTCLGAAAALCSAICGSNPSCYQFCIGPLFPEPAGGGGAGGGGGGEPNICQPPPNSCPPCPAPPPGYSRYDTGHPHFPCPGAHTHVYSYEYNQNPETCQCFLKRSEEVICE
jgi:RHS repeat-associated protein